MRTGEDHQASDPHKRQQSPRPTASSTWSFDSPVFPNVPQLVNMTTPSRNYRLKLPRVCRFTSRCELSELGASVRRQQQHIAMDVAARGEACVLRRIVPEDVDDVTAACQDEDTQRFTTVPVPYLRGDAETFVERNLTTDWFTADSALFVISRLGTGTFDGAIDLRFDEFGAASVGYAVAPWARRQGVGTDALRAACAWGFRERHLQRIEWEAVVGNWASRKTAERVGFHIEGTCRARVVLRGLRHDGWLAGLLREDLFRD